MAKNTKPIVSFEESFDKIDIREGSVVAAVEWGQIGGTHLGVFGARKVK